MSYLQPFFPMFVILGLIGVGVGLTRRRALPRLMSTSFIGVFLISWPPVAWLLTLPLQYRYAQRPPPAPAHVDAIVVLASYVASPSPYNPYYLPDLGTHVRTHHAAWLYHNWNTVPILVVGGGAEGVSFAATMKIMIAAQNVPDGAIWTEESSRSTHESAVATARMLQQRGVRRIALVTEAFHMLRAELSFRKQGFEVIPAPCRFLRFDGKFWELLPGSESIRRSEVALHEQLGLFWYWIQGWI